MTRSIEAYFQMQKKCQLCCDLFSPVQGAFKCSSKCTTMSHGICLACTGKTFSMDNPRCPNCREQLPDTDRHFALANDAPPAAEQQLGQDGFMNGIYVGELHNQDDQDEDDEYQNYLENLRIVIAARRAMIPCWHHFMRNGLRRVPGCCRHGCPYSHVLRRCPYGWRCRREWCRFLHN